MKNETPIGAARKKSGKTQAQVAQEVKIAKNAYQQYEYGRNLPNVILANRIARALNTTTPELWGY